MSEVKLGVIGGSGVYDMESLTEIEERSIHTPFGDTSDRSYPLSLAIFKASSRLTTPT